MGGRVDLAHHRNAVFQHIFLVFAVFFLGVVKPFAVRADGGEPRNVGFDAEPGVVAKMQVDLVQLEPRHVFSYLFDVFERYPRAGDVQHAGARFVGGVIHGAAAAYKFAVPFAVTHLHQRYPAVEQACVGAGADGYCFGGYFKHVPLAVNGFRQ